MGSIREIRIRNISCLILVLFVTTVVTRAEEFRRSTHSETYFRGFENAGALSQLWRSPEYPKAVLDINVALTNQPFLGVDKSLNVQPSGTRQNREHVQLSRGERAAVDSNFNNDTVTEKISLLDSGNVTSSGLDHTDSGVTSGSDRLLATSGDFPNETNLGTSERVSTSFTGTSERVSTSFPGTSQEIPTTTSASSSQCLLDTQRVFSSVISGEQWGLAFLDSWGKPGPGLLKGQLKFVGSYRECLESTAPTNNGTGSAGFRGNYCAVGMAFPGPAQSFLMASLSSAPISIGSCMPSSCSAEDIFGLFEQGLTAANLTSSIYVTAVDCRTDEREYTAASIVSIIFLSIIGLLMILGTAYDILFVQWPKWAESNDSDDDEYLPTNEKTNGYHPITGYDTKGQATVLLDDDNHGASAYPEGKNGAVSAAFSERKPLLGKGPKESHGKSGGHAGVLSKVLMAFSVYSNGKKMLNTSQPAGSLGAIHGIRFLSMSWVILGHTYVFSLSSFTNLATAMPMLLNRWTFDAISNALVSVDTFFALSGLLTAYLTYKEIQKKGWKLNWAMYYFHRFWRLTPPYMLVLVTSLGLHRFLGSGAMWSTTQPMDKEVCEDNWWTNLLYINNFVKSDKMCLGHSWYLANDMQFHILSPLLIVPFFFHIYAGLGTSLVFLLASWITTGVLSTDNEWGSNMMQTSVKVGGLDYFHYYYIAPYCRIGPFVIGILSGYFLAVTKGKYNMKWYYAVLGWVLAIAVGLASVYGIHGDTSGANPSSVGVAAFYNTVARTAWGACVCWVIVSCACGYGGPVNALLSWSPFVSLGRLTYMAYLIHPTIIRAFTDNMDQTFYLNDTSLVIAYLGILVFTNLVSFVLVLAFESPMIGLEKVFLRH